MDRAVVAELLGKMVPLTARPHALDDPVERQTPIGPLPSTLLGRRKRSILQEDGFDPRPEFIRDFPGRFQWLDRLLLPSQRLALVLL